MVNQKIYLASNSPRRKELMTMLGLEFDVRVGDYEEDNALPLSPKDLVLHHSINKARSAAKGLDKGVVIAADTVVVLNNEVLGKPHNVEEARAMLVKISGQWVESISGLAVIDIASKKELQEFENTRIKFKDLTTGEIEKYLATGEPIDKAGAFAVQLKGAVLIEKIEGDFFNVVGLPLFKLNKLLGQLGLAVL